MGLIIVNYNPQIRSQGLFVNDNGDPGNEVEGLDEILKCLYLKCELANETKK